MDENNLQMIKPRQKDLIEYIEGNSEGNNHETGELNTEKDKIKIFEGVYFEKGKNVDAKDIIEVFYEGYEAKFCIENSKRLIRTSMTCPSSEVNPVIAKRIKEMAYNALEEIKNHDN